jgi:hypothetical protein
MCTQGENFEVEPRFYFEDGKIKYVDTEGSTVIVCSVGTIWDQEFFNILLEGK